MLNYRILLVSDQYLIKDADKHEKENVKLFNDTSIGC